MHKYIHIDIYIYAYLYVDSFQHLHTSNNYTYLFISLKEYELPRFSKSTVNFAPKRARLAMININKKKKKIINDPSLNSMQRTSGNEFNSLSNIMKKNELSLKGIDKNSGTISTIVQNTLFESIVVLLYGSFPNSGNYMLMAIVTSTRVYADQFTYVYTHIYKCISTYMYYYGITLWLTT